MIKQLSHLQKKLPPVIAAKVEKYIPYSRISAVLNIVANAEGTIINIL
ncbi:TPA: hypothetical protein R9N60_000529 [Clostridium perfringens]|uniref:Uncharacterized protein n=1 Tax=Clostridium perfringens TaxID=1502 RepID=A0AAP6WMJ3_CLOPF|nr:hypothetical protein [Clostridium perfringens]NGU30553.1 hypothetical protein [Clostridium perfringens]HEE9817701.1 hypothetical protein [Clostridium perfringens]